MFASAAVVLPDEAFYLRVTHSESGRRELGKNGRIVGRIGSSGHIDLRKKLRTKDDWQIFVIGDVLQFGDDYTTCLLIIKIVRVSRECLKELVGHSVVFTKEQSMQNRQQGLRRNSAISCFKARGTWREHV